MIYLLISIFFSTVFSESIKYNVKYNNIKAGTAFFSHNVLKKDSTNFKEISFSVKSNKLIDIFYKLRIKVSMTVDADEYFIYNLRKNNIEGKKRDQSFSIINYNIQKIMYNDQKIMFNGEKVYSILSLIYFLRNQKLKVGKEYSINIYNNGSITPVIASIIDQYIEEEINYFVIEVKSKNKNKNHMKLILSEVNNSNIPIYFELNTKNGIMELSIDE